MKKVVSLCAALAAVVSAAAEVPVFPVVKSTTPVVSAALKDEGDHLLFLFRLAPDAGEKFAVSNVYVYVDNDVKTGRKGIGNEYFIDVPKGMVSGYAADGKGTLHRKAVTASRRGEWYILSVDKKSTAANPFTECEIVFAAGGKKDRIKMRGNAPAKADFPER